MRDLKTTAENFDISETKAQEILDTLGEEATDDQILDFLADVQEAPKKALKMVDLGEAKGQDNIEKAAPDVEKTDMTIDDLTMEDAIESGRYNAALYAKVYKETFETELTRLRQVHLDMRQNDFDKFVEQELAKPSVKPQVIKKKARPRLDYKAMGLA